MRTTLDLDDRLLEEAMAEAPSRTKTALVEEALRALLRERAIERLIHAAGSAPTHQVPERRRP